MLTTVAHITETKHLENTNIIHWLSTNPSAAIGICLLIGLMLISIIDISRKSSK